MHFSSHDFVVDFQFSSYIFRFSRDCRFSFFVPLTFAVGVVVWWPWHWIRTRTEALRVITQPSANHANLPYAELAGEVAAIFDSRPSILVLRLSLLLFVIRSSILVFASRFSILALLVLIFLQGPLSSSPTFPTVISVFRPSSRRL